jgi:hypothetical protein
MLIIVRDSSCERNGGLLAHNLDNMSAEIGAWDCPGCDSWLLGAPKAWPRAGFVVRNSCALQRRCA